MIETLSPEKVIFLLIAVAVMTLIIYFLRKPS